MKKHPLDRLLRLRSLLEDIGRMELEMRLQELAQIERALTQRMADRKSMRAQSFAGFAHADGLLSGQADGFFYARDSGPQDGCGRRPGWCAGAVYARVGD